jgi:hypothetical protein
MQRYQRLTVKPILGDEHMTYSSIRSSDIIRISKKAGGHKRHRQPQQQLRFGESLPHFDQVCFNY